jgi:rubrerythrin
MAILAVIIFGVAFVVIASSAFRTFSSFGQSSRMIGKAFELAEQEIDRKLREGNESESSPTTRQCAFCGASFSAHDACPGCGAPADS